MLAFVAALALASAILCAPSATSAAASRLTAAERTRLFRFAADRSRESAERAACFERAIGAPRPARSALPASHAESSRPAITQAFPVGACGNWTQWFAETEAFARVGHAMIYDPVGGRLVVFGGEGDDSVFSNDVWTLSMSGTSQWTRLVPGGTPPSPRIGATAVYDAPHRRMIVFGGEGESAEGLSDTWALALSGSPAWQQIAATGTQPPGRFEHVAIADPTHNRMLVFAGIHFDSNVGYVDVNDVWALSLAGGGGWTQLAPTGTPPAPRSDAVAVLDSARSRMILFGGSRDDGSGGYVGTNEVWSLALSGTPSWTSLSPGGVSAPSRIAASAVADVANGRMIVFGGFDPAGPRDQNDAWALALASPAWSLLTPAGAPPDPTEDGAAAFDAGRRRMVVFGGTAGDDAVWGLSLAGSAAWAEVATVDTVPRTRQSASMVFDAANDRLLVYGGASAVGRAMSDVWSHPASAPGAWSRLHPTGTRPVRVGHCAAIDSGDAHCKARRCDRVERGWYRTELG